MDKKEIEVKPNTDYNFPKVYRVHEDSEELIERMIIAANKLMEESIAKKGKKELRIKGYVHFTSGFKRSIDIKMINILKKLNENTTEEFIDYCEQLGISSPEQLLKLKEIYNGRNKDKTDKQKEYKKTNRRG